jgi:hypothetical protein
LQSGLLGREVLTYADIHSVTNEKIKGQRHYAHDALWKRNLNIRTDMVIILQHILSKNLSTLYDSNGEVILFQSMDEKFIVILDHKFHTTQLQKPKLLASPNRITAIEMILITMCFRRQAITAQQLLHKNEILSQTSHT